MTEVYYKNKSIRTHYTTPDVNSSNRLNSFETLGSLHTLGNLDSLHNLDSVDSVGSVGNSLHKEPHYHTPVIKKYHTPEIPNYHIPIFKKSVPFNVDNINTTLVNNSFKCGLLSTLSLNDPYNVNSYKV